MWWGVLGVSLSVAFAACSVAETRERVVGTIAFHGDPVRLEVPSEVTRGQPFTVEVITYGDGCREQGETEVELEGLRAEVTPYDHQVTPPPGAACTLELNQHRHRATLRFEDTGTAEVVFHGREEDRGGTNMTSVTRTLELR